jgi:hypothetical protein
MSNKPVTTSSTSNGASRSAEFARSLSLSELIGRVAGDVATLARDEVALAKLELGAKTEEALISATGLIVSAGAAFLGLSLLTGAVIVAAAPLFPALWARLFLASIVYLFGGTSAAVVFAVKLRRAGLANKPLAVEQAERTTAAVERELAHD